MIGLYTYIEPKTAGAGLARGDISEEMDIHREIVTLWYTTDSLLLSSLELSDRQSLWALNTSPSRKCFTFLASSCSYTLVHHTLERWKGCVHVKETGTNIYIWAFVYLPETLQKFTTVPHEGVSSSLSSAAPRDKSREWGLLEAKVEPLLTLCNSGF